MFQQLRCGISMVGEGGGGWQCMGPIPGQGTKISHAVWYGRRKERKRKKEGRKERKRKKGRKEEGRWTIYFKGPAPGRMQVKKDAAWIQEHKYHALIE